MRPTRRQGGSAGPASLKMIPPRRIKRGLFTALLLAAIFLAPNSLAGEELSEYGNPFTWVTIGRVRIKAEVVKTPEKIYLGLSHRQDLPEGRGLLFIMPLSQVQIFCMRGMQFPLDIIWLVPGKVVGLEKNVSPQYPGNLSSPEPVNFVLEVPGGFSEKYGIKVGDKASW